MVNTKQVIGGVLILGAGYFAVTQFAGDQEQTPTMLASGLSPLSAGGSQTPSNGGSAPINFTVESSENPFADSMLSAPSADTQSKKDSSSDRQFSVASRVGGGTISRSEAQRMSATPEGGFSEQQVASAVGGGTISRSEAERMSAYKAVRDSAPAPNTSSKKDSDKRKERSSGGYSGADGYSGVTR